jgi:glycosyltransferase involved in cell wall biosynthesis
VKEGLPYVLLEAALAGVPILATDTGGISEIIGKDQLVQSKKPTMLEEKIKDLLQSQNVTTELAEKTEANVRENFSLKAMVTNTNSVYKA